MAQTLASVEDVEEALVGHWSHFGRWPEGALVEEEGTLRYETPIPHLPYNGVLRTRIEGDADQVVARVAASFRDRGVACVWWDHPTAAPDDLGARLRPHGYEAVEQVVGMALELGAARPAQGGPPEVRYEEVLDDEALRVYTDLIIGYWELPDDARELVHAVNSYWGPGRVQAHRWLATLDGRPVGKVLLSLAAPPGVAAIYGMSVRPEARGKGIAAGLTEVALARAQELGCRRVVLHATQMAVRVYERAGFVKVCDLTAYANAPLWASRMH